MKFDSKVVIPTQFVLFNFTAIVGSAVLYRDFDSLPFERMVIFLYGCAATFAGVFVLARATPSAEENDEEQADGAESEGRRPESLLRQLSFSPTHTNPALPFPRPESPTPRGGGSQQMNGSASLRASLRPRTSSTTIGLSPAKYLLLATGTTPPTSSSVPIPVLALPLARQHSLPQGSSHHARPGGGSTSRSPSRDRGGVGESYGSRNGRRSRINTIE